MIEVTSGQAGFRQLRREDSSWDYKGEDTKRYTHGFHSYPAMMIPQVAHRLISLFGKEGDTLLDPFCGSGSVLVEAKVAKLNSWGIDLNPLAALIARVKTTPIEHSLLIKEYDRVMECIRKLPQDKLSFPQFYNIDFWFKQPVIECLARIKSAIETIKAVEIREFFQVAFSEVARLSSNSRSHEFKLYRYNEKSLENHWPDPIRMFTEQAQKNIQRMWDFHDICPANVWSKVIQADATKTVADIEPESIDIIVTSPPYGDSRTTVAYGQFSRLSAQWLGLMPERAPDIDKRMLGGSPAKDLAAKSPSNTLNSAIEAIGQNDVERARQVKAFYDDLAICLKNMAWYLRKKGQACIVIGNRRVKGLQLPTDVIICELAETMGLRPLQIIVRNIPSKTMPLKNSPTNVAGAVEETMNREYIIVLLKD